MFAGSYLGGAMTLFGVIITLRHERKLHQHQLMIESIEKERERLFAIISKLDVFAPSACYLDFVSVTCIKDWNKRSDLPDVRRRITEARRQLNQSNQELLLGTDICNKPADCAKNDQLRRLSEVRAEFQEVYTYVNRSLFDTLQSLELHIVDQYKNAVLDEMIYTYRETIDLCKEHGHPCQYREEDIENLQNQKKDLADQREKLEERLNDILSMNQKEMVRLINLVREYCTLRIQNAERIHMSEK